MICYGYEKRGTGDKFWMNGFLGFLGPLGFEAFKLHNPLYLFLFFCILCSFQISQRWAQIFGFAWRDWINRGNPWGL